jgi:hypothetical protein
LFFVKSLRAGSYRFTLSATTVAQPDPVVLLSRECSIVRTQQFLLTQNQFDDNYLDALEFFGGDTDKFLFHYSRREGRYIATDEDWRNKYLVVSSLGRVHVDALPHFEAAEHYLKNTYVRVSLQNPVTGLVSEGSVLLLDELLEKSATYVPRFQSNQEYISHHTFGTAIDVNDTMVPNKNRPENHEVIGDDVKNHLIYNGIPTDENGVRITIFSIPAAIPADTNGAEDDYQLSSMSWRFSARASKGLLLRNHLRRDALHAHGKRHQPPHAHGHRAEEGLRIRRAGVDVCAV